MKIKALITSLVLGSSSLALANPVSVSASAQASWSFGSSQPVVRDHRWIDTSYDREQVNQPVVVREPIVAQPIDDGCADPHNTSVGSDASAYRGPITAAPSYEYASYGSDRYWHGPVRLWTVLTQPTRIDRGREFFTIGAQAGRFNTLKLQSMGGRSTIGGVYIQFANGEEQRVITNTRIDRSNPSLTIDLSGRDRQIKRVIVYGSSGARSAYQLEAM